MSTFAGREPGSGANGRAAGGAAGADAGRARHAALGGAPPAASEGLQAHFSGFVLALRRAGVPVGVSEEIDGARVLGVVDLVEREQLRAGLASVCVKRPAHREAFDTLFDLWWPAAIGDGVRAADDETGLDSGDVDADAEEWRRRLAEALRDGDLDALRRLAREAVAKFGRDSSPGSDPSFLSYRVLRALTPETLVAGLLDSLLRGRNTGPLAEYATRQALEDKLAAFRKYVEDDARRRTAENRGRDILARQLIRRPIEETELLRMQRADIAEMRRTIWPLARRLAARLASQRRLARSGRLDFRRTVRASLGTGGVPLTTHHRPPRPHRPELVVLCDVSASVAGFSHFTLLFTAALREQFSKVRVFAFIDTCDEVTSLFAPGADLTNAVARLADANLVEFDGHSDYANSFEVFASKWPDAVSPRSTLLVLGDARVNYLDRGLPIIRDLVRRARHAYWLNPEPKRMWSTGDSGASDYGEIMPMYECSTVAQLAEFVGHLLPR